MQPHCAALVLELAAGGSLEDAVLSGINIYIGLVISLVSFFLLPLLASLAYADACVTYADVCCRLTGRWHCAHAPEHVLEIAHV
jgi:hypothetical protein